MAENNQNNPMGKALELDAETAMGIYSNLLIKSHSTSEFILDFATILPAIPKAKVRSRIILTPEHAKRLLMSLQENVQRYESAIGKIEIPQHTLPQNFNKMGQA